MYIFRQIAEVVFVGIKWSETLATGVTKIDEQHKELFTRVNSLLEAMSQGKGKEEIGKVVKFLGDYVVGHFSMEEALMDKENYPDKINHKAQHKAFINEFQQIKKELETGSPSTIALIQTQRKIVDWLTNHIGATDKKLGDFLKKK